ncbi:hypothetical protein ACIRG4_15450 [Streptomyces sp. NPDC102395]|uniref:hypothetical protein n=1 Tax=Streptomyces sp. NPDC102395 TaxID=3366168 RepID=UPI003809A435
MRDADTPPEGCRPAAVDRHADPKIITRADSQSIRAAETVGRDSRGHDGAKTRLGLTSKTVSRPKDASGFVVLPRRWAVERPRRSPRTAVLLVPVSRQWGNSLRNAGRIGVRSLFT